MASSGKRKTTMAKLARESRLRERRLDKQARKDARKLAATQHPNDAQSTVTSESYGQAPGSPLEKPSLSSSGSTP
jgi:hypothetical protein